MTSNFGSTYDVSESLRLEFLDDFRDRLTTMERCLAGAEDGTRDPGEALREFRRELHNIKGMGGSFGFPSLSLICHRYEECLLHLPEKMFGTAHVVSLYLDQIIVIAETGQDPDEENCRRLLRSLPLIGEAPKNGKKASGAALEVLIVAASKTIRLKVRRDLIKFGFHVTTATDGINALSLIVRGQPDVVIVSGTIEGMPRFDLIRALVAMKSTAKIRVAALTSFDLEHPDILMLPEGIPVIQLTSDMEGQISRALSSLEYRFL